VTTWAIGLVQHSPGMSDLDRAWARGLIIRHARDARLRILDVLELGDDDAVNGDVLRRLAQVATTVGASVLLTNGVDLPLAERVARELDLRQRSVVVRARPSAST
jgi:hypothetical protein